LIKGVGYGIIEGGIAGGITFLLILIDPFALFAVLAVWLVMGWISTFFIAINTLEILALLVSSALVSGVIYYFSTIHLGIISLIVGLGALFWIISFTTKTFLFQKPNEPTK
jgi:hypothetical protein